MHQNQKEQKDQEIKNSRKFFLKLTSKEYIHLKL
jgi:hypothetical protein